MPKLLFRPKAKADLRSIFSYIAEEAPQSALVFIDEIQKTCHRYAEFPLAGKARSELQENLRSFPFSNYIIFYEPVEDGIEVARVLHGSRDIDRQF